MKKTFEERFKELFFDQIEYTETTYHYDIRTHSICIFFFNNEKIYLGDYNYTTKKFWLSSRKIWKALDFEYDHNYEEIGNITKSILEEHFKLKDVSLHSF